MGNYKILNITNNLDKRNPNYNSVLKLEYPENMIKKTAYIKPRQEIIMSLSSLPQPINYLKMCGLIIVEEINEFQVKKFLNKKINTSTKEEFEVKKNTKLH